MADRLFDLICLADWNPIVFIINAKENGSAAKVTPALFLLSRQSGAGKERIAKRFLQSIGDKNLKKKVTTTSMQPRKSEVNRADYHFMSKDECVR
jgi:guanylate kinase